MEIINKLVLLVLIGASSTEVYNWNVRTLEHNAGSDTDFGDELKLQSALSNELQRDLMKISGKATENSERNMKYTQVNKDSAKGNVNKEDNQQQQSNAYNIGVPRPYDVYNAILSDSKIQTPSYNSPKFVLDGSDSHFNKTAETYKQQLYQDIGSNGSNDNQNDRSANERKYDDRKKHQNSSSDIRKKNHNKNPQYNYEYNYDDNNLITTDKNEKRVNSTNQLYNHKFYELNKDHDHLRDVYGKLVEQKGFVEESKLNENIEQYGINNEERHAKGLYAMTTIPADIKIFLGSNLFDSTTKNCFTRDDIILLQIRKDFENLMPKDLPNCLLNDRMLAILMNYFYICHQLISTLTLDESKPLVLKVFFDALGGYLNYYLVPVAKYSYYAGKLSLETTNHILRLHEQCKRILNTNGNGWRAPIADVLVEFADNVYIEPLQIDDDSEMDEPSFCMQLDIASDYNESNEMIVPLPWVDIADEENDYLGNLWLPFRYKQVHDLKSLSSAYILVEFYYAVTKCYQFENVDQDCYNAKLKKWLLENIIGHLDDDTFYPGLGAVLRVYVTLTRGRQIIMWETDDNVEENRKKKSYRARKNPKSKMFIELPPQYQHYKEKHNAWHRDRDIFQTNNHKEKSLRKETENLNRFKTVDDSGERQHQFTDEQLKLAAAIIEEQAMANNQTNSQWHIRNISTIQWVLIIVPILVFVSIITICCCLQFRKKRKKHQVSLREPGGGGKRKSKKNEEETHLLDANSKSVVHGNYNTSKSHRFKAPPHMRNVSSSAAGSTASSSSSLLCQLPAKCFAIKGSGPAIIETTSFDYSSSETEDKAVKKAHMKSVKIDNKSGKHKGNDNPTAGEAVISNEPMSTEKKSKEIPKK